jgi:hypothetical protein
MLGRECASDSVSRRRAASGVIRHIAVAHEKQLEYENEREEKDAEELEYRLYPLADRSACRLSPRSRPPLLTRTVPAMQADVGSAVVSAVGVYLPTMLSLLLRIVSVQLGGSITGPRKPICPKSTVQSILARGRSSSGG